MQRKGSVLVYVLVMMTSTAVVILSAAELAMMNIRGQRRQEESTRARMAYDSAIQAMYAVKDRDGLTYPATINVDIEGLAVRLVVTDTSSTLAQSITVEGTVTIEGRPYTITRTMGKRDTPNPLFYSLFAGGSLIAQKTLTTGGSDENGDIYVKSTSTFVRSGSTVDGDLEVTASIINAGNVSASGHVWEGAEALSLPNPADASYLLASTNTYLLGLNTTNYSFAPVLLSGASYPVTYVTGDMTFKGTITNKGVFFVTGNLRINGPVSYANASSKAIFIVQGNIDIDFGSGGDIVGYYYTKGSIQVDASGNNTIRNISRALA